MTTADDAAARVGPYRLVRELARGGMGVVYEAVDERDGSPVAVKQLLHAGPEPRARFLREARITRGLDHPHIARTLDHGGVDEPTAWMAMELLRGATLDALTRSRRLAPAEVVGLAVQACDALAYAHGRGIVHRDLKPQNLFVLEGEPLRVKVLDFGIARAEHEGALTSTGSMLGTWAYMSPEQARGDREVDARSDLWSLGAVLFELLAGRALFKAESGAAVLYSVLFGELPALREAAPGVPAALAAVVDRCLRRDPRERFASARALRDALDAADLGAQATPTGPSPRAVSEAAVERRLTVIALASGVRDPLLLGGLASNLGGEVVTLRGDDRVVCFGLDRWTGEEPFQAVRFARSAAPLVRAVAVVTGRTVQGDAAPLVEAVDRAAALIRPGPPRLDEATASAVRSRLALRHEDGVWTLRDDVAEVAEESWGTAFVGRELERALLLDAAERAVRELTCESVLVTAPPGMGKTRLVAEALRGLSAVAPTARVLRLRGDAALRDAPLAALREVLRDVQDADLADALAPGAGGDPTLALDRLRVAVQSLLVGFAGDGLVVLVIDDAQWVDAPTRTLLRWVVQNTDGLPLAIWATARSEARDEVMAWLPAATQRELGPLTAPQVASILAAWAPPPLEALVERAAGHPLFAEELGRWYAAHPDGAREGLPVSIESVHLAALDSLPPSDRDFVKRAAVLGRIGWVEAVAAMGGEAAAAVRLRKAGVFAPRPRSRFESCQEFGFRSALLAEVALRLWTEPQRQKLHAAAAAWLEGRARATPEEVAEHWELAVEAERAAGAWARAAEEAGRVGDPSIAARHAERALDLSRDDRTRWRALVARDQAFQIDGDRAAQRQGLEAIEALAPALGLDAMAEAAWRRCYFARMTDDPATARSQGEQAIDLAVAADAPLWRLAALLDLAQLAADEGRHDEALARARGARDLSMSVGAPWFQARAAGVMAYALVEAGRQLDEGIALHAEAARAYARAGDRRREAVSLTNEGYALLLVGRVPEALEHVEASLALSRQVANRRAAAVALQNRGTIHRMLEAWEAAEGDLSSAMREARALDHRRLIAAVAAERVYLALARGHVDVGTLTLVEEAIAAASHAGAPAQATTASALASRVRSRLGGLRPGEVAELRAQYGAGADDEGALEVAVALAECGEAQAHERCVAIVERLAADRAGGEGVDLCRAALRRRFVIGA